MGNSREAQADRKLKGSSTRQQYQSQAHSQSESRWRLSIELCLLADDTRLLQTRPYSRGKIQNQPRTLSLVLAATAVSFPLPGIIADHTL